MINIPKNLLRDIKDGAAFSTDLEKYLIENYSISDIIKSFVELLLENDTNRQPISISAEEFNMITSLFRVRGIRVSDDGKITSETRGRKRKFVVVESSLFNNDNNNNDNEKEDF